MYTNLYQCTYLIKASFQRASGVGIIARLTGQYLDATQCEVQWSHGDQQTVGKATVATVKVVSEYLLPHTDTDTRTQTHALIHTQHIHTTHTHTYIHATY